MSQIKPRLSQGRAGLRCKIKTPVPPLISKPIAQVREKPVEQQKPQYPKLLEYKLKLYQYQTTQFLIQDPEMIQVLEWSTERLYRISTGSYLYIQIQHTDPLLNQ